MLLRGGHRIHAVPGFQVDGDALGLGMGLDLVEDLVTGALHEIDPFNGAFARTDGFQDWFAAVDFFAHEGPTSGNYFLGKTRYCPPLTSSIVNPRAETLARISSASLNFFSALSCRRVWANSSTSLGTETLWAVVMPKSPPNWLSFSRASPRRLLAPAVGRASWLKTRRTSRARSKRAAMALGVLKSSSMASLNFPSTSSMARRSSKRSIGPFPSGPAKASSMR